MKLWVSHKKEIEKINAKQDEQSAMMEDMDRRIGKMMATLNGEDGWFLERVPATKKECNEELGGESHGLQLTNQ